MYNYPKFLLNKGWKVDIDNWLSLVILSLKIESEGSYKFTCAMYPDRCQREYLLHTMDLGREDTKEDSEARIVHMVQVNEQRNTRKRELHTVNQESPSPQKDKGKTRERILQKEDIPWLRQQWYDEYEELL